MGFSLRFDGHVPASFVDAVCPTADEVNRRRWEATNGVGELVIKAQESKIWDCAPSPTAQRESMKFEAGQVVRFDELHISSGNKLVVRCVEKGDVWCVGVIDKLSLYKLQIAEWGPRAVLLSPAPCAGDTWTSGESVVQICRNGPTDSTTNLRIVSDGEPFVGDVVAVARKLWDGGYRRLTSVARTPLTGRVEGVYANGREVKADGVIRAGDLISVRVGESAPRAIAKGETIEVPMSTALSAFGGTWPASTPSADVDGGVYPTRESVERLYAAEKAYLEAKRRAGAPAVDFECAGEEYRRTMEDAAVQMTRLICGSDEAEKLRAEQQRLSAPRDAAVFQLPPLAEGEYLVSIDSATETATLRNAEGDVVPGVARIDAGPARPGYVALDAGKGWTVMLPDAAARLPQDGDVYRNDEQVLEICARGDRLHAKVIQSTRPAGMEEGATMPAAMLAGFLSRRGYRYVCAVPTERECAQIANESQRDSMCQRRIDATTPQSPLDGALTELRAGMVVRCRFPAVTHFGRVASVDDKRLSIKWLHERKPATYMKHVIAESWARDEWRIVTPDVRPLASLAHAVAAIFALTDRATSRRYVDDALALLRGEPFVDAIRAALVGTSERANLTPSEIAATIAALRHWEKHRPFDRDLGALQRRTGDRHRGGPWNRLQLEATDVLVRALGYRPVWDYDNLWFLYERARASR